MLKTSNTKSAEPIKGGVRVGGSNKARYDKSEVNGGEFDGGEVESNEVGKKVPKLSKYQ